MGFSATENGSRKILSPKYAVSDVPISIAGSYFGGSHPGLCMFVFVDGHVQAVSEAAAVEVLTAIATRDGGETLDSNAF